MLPDRVSNPGPLTYESGALPIALRGPSVVENWIIDPAARVRFPLKSLEFFQPNLLCFVLCYGFRVVRWGLVRDGTSF